MEKIKNEKNAQRETTFRPLRRCCAMGELLTPLSNCGSYIPPSSVRPAALQNCQYEEIRKRQALAVNTVKTYWGVTENKS